MCTWGLSPAPLPLPAPSSCCPFPPRPQTMGQAKHRTKLWDESILSALNLNFIPGESQTNTFRSPLLLKAWKWELLKSYSSVDDASAAHSWPELFTAGSLILLEPPKVKRADTLSNLICIALELCRNAVTAKIDPGLKGWNRSAVFYLCFLYEVKMQSFVPAFFFVYLSDTQKNSKRSYFL